MHNFPQTDHVTSLTATAESHHGISEQDHLGNPGFQQPDEGHYLSVSDGIDGDLCVSCDFCDGAVALAVAVVESLVC